MKTARVVIVRAIVLFLLFSFSSISVAWAAPSITKISPTVGPVSPVGAPLTITGTGFGTIQGTSSVTVGGVVSVPTSWSDTRIVAPLPGSLTPGSVDVIVTVGGVASNAKSFFVIPVITAVSPATAPVGGAVTVTGTSFGDIQGASTLTFNGLAAVPTAWSNTGVTFPVPVGALSGPIVVTVNGFATNGVNYWIAPKIDSISPASGPNSGTVTLAGSGFGRTQNFNPVTFGGVSVTPLSWSDTSIAVPVPSGLPVANANLIVKVNTTASNAVPYLVTPFIGGLSANSGPAGASITLTGTSFGASQGASTIAFNGLPATPSFWSDTSITVPVPSGAASGPVIATVNGIASNGVTFTVLSPPMISALNPASGSAGTLVTITGSNFGISQGSGQVRIGGQPMTVSSWSDSSVIAAVAPGTATGGLVLTTGAGLPSNAASFIVSSAGPLLQLSIRDTPLQVNLTSAPNLDWIHWGRIAASLPDRKNGTAPLISDYTAFGGAQPSVSAGVTNFSWSDGNHPAAVSQSTSDIEIFNTGGGFQITVPADTTVRTLNLYSEVLFGQGVVEASLSDGSAAALTDQSVSDSDFASKVYSIDYRAASAGQTLTVKISSAALTGGIGLQAATLTPHLPIVIIDSPTVGESLSSPATIPFSVNAAQLDSSAVALQLSGSDGSVFQGSSAPLSANWGPLPGGHYTATATATDAAGLANSALPVEFDVIGQGGSLSIDEVAPSSPIDLNSQGTADWILWGPASSTIDSPGHILARKAGVAPLISDYKPIGNHPVNSIMSGHDLCFAGDQQSYCSGSMLAVHGLKNGFEIGVPADTTPRTLQFYVGAAFGDGRITAFLSDGSSPVATEKGAAGPPPPLPTKTTLYTINYSAASSGQTLTVRFTLDVDLGDGDVVLIGAALSGAPVTLTVPAPQIALIEPGTSPVNTQVTVTGTNFGATQGRSSVFFGSIAARVVSWSDTSITAIVPSAFADGANVQVAVSTGAGFSNLGSVTIPSFHVFPESLTMLVGQTQGLQATDAAGNPITGLQWTSSDLTIVRFSTDDPPFVTAISAGTATVYVGDVPVPVTVYATAPPLVSITIAPQSAQVPSGMTQQFTATGAYADGSTRDLTTTATWSSASPSLATVNSAGRATGIQAGTATIQASVGSISTLATLIVQPPSLKSLTLAPAIPGTTVGGTQQFRATGVFTDGSTQDLTASVTWSSAIPAVATMDVNGLATGTGSGRTVIRATQGTITALVTLNVAATTAPPSIRAVPSQAPNGAGWNNSSVTVTFQCTAGSSAIVTCPDSQTISSEGTGQSVSGTVTDAAGNTASASAIINLDRTKPALAVASPVDGGLFSNAALTVTGTANDALSGLASVTCNGSAATLSGADFSCNVSLNPGVNLLAVRTTDLAGNVSVAIMHLTLNTPLPPPQSLQITPGMVNMLVGDTQRFTAVDERGRPRTDAIWAISDNSLATISTDNSPVLTAVADGQVTLTASAGSMSTQAQVHILFGTFLPVGTPRWSIPDSAGFSAALAFRAEPVEGAPDLYSVERSPAGALNVRALTGDGQQLWSTQIPGQTGQTVVGAGDGNGGLLLTRRENSSNHDLLIDLDAQTGATLWSYGLTGVTQLNPTEPAISSDGTLYFWEQTDTGLLNSPPPQAYLVALDGLTGSQLARYPIPIGTITSDDGKISPQLVPSVTDPVIDSDGTVWAAYAVTNVSSNSFSETLSLLKATPDGGVSMPVIKTLSGDPSFGPFAGPWQIIPNGQGGALVSWSTNTFSPAAGDFVYHVSNVTSDGGSADFTFPSWMNKMVLGENGIAYADNFGEVRAFDTNSGASPWTYSPGPFVNLVGVLSGGGVIVNQSNLGLVTLDSAGKAIASLGINVPSAVPWALVNWAGVFNNSFAFFPGPTARFLASNFSILFGDAQNQRRAKTPEISNFVPSHLANTATSYDFLDFIDEMNTVNPSPRIMNKFFVRGQVVDNQRTLTQAASVDNFLSEVKRPVDAVAFIGHSLETGQNTPDYSIGMMFYYPVSGPIASTLLPETFPQRDLTPDDICILGSGFENCLFPLQKNASTLTSTIASYKNIPAVGAPPFMNDPPMMGKLIDRIPRQAKIVFIGSCEVQDELLGAGSPILQMWDIHNASTDALGTLVPATKGSALIAPLSTPLDALPNQRGTHLAVAARVWIRILENMVGHSQRVGNPMNVKAAVDEANKWAHASPDFPFPLSPSDTWQVIGDPTVRLR